MRKPSPTSSPPSGWKWKRSRMPARGLPDFTVAYVISAEKHPNADRLKLCMVDTGERRAGAGRVRRAQCPCRHEGGVRKARHDHSRHRRRTEDRHDPRRGIARHAVFGARASARRTITTASSSLPPMRRWASRRRQALGLTDAVIDVCHHAQPRRCGGRLWHRARSGGGGAGHVEERRGHTRRGQIHQPAKASRSISPTSRRAPARSLPAVSSAGVKNGPSPEWVQDRLRAVGQRPISALVDVTNLISLDRGRPLHVFDADKLKGNVAGAHGQGRRDSCWRWTARPIRSNSTMCVIADDDGARAASPA